MQSPENFGSERPSGTPQPVQAAPQYGAPLPNPTGNYEIQRISGRRVLKRIDPGSAFKIGAVISALTWAVIGLPFIFLMGAIMSQIPGANNNGATAMGGGIFGYLFGIVIYGIGGGVGAVIWAFIYNLVAGWMGGIEFDLE